MSTQLARRRIYRGDLYAPAALADPYSRYRRIRDLGPAVWMARHDLWAIGRFDDVRGALRADGVLISGRGVAANDAVNRVGNPITLTSDGEDHIRRRHVLIQPLLPGPLKDLRPRLEAMADQLVSELATGRPFEAVSRFASHLPLAVVAELVGLDEAGRQNMLAWAAATFAALGVLNARGKAAIPQLHALGQYIQRLDRTAVAPDGWAARLFDAADRGALTADEARAMIIDYVAPALDTTILATGHLLWRLATTPGAYETLRSEPALIPSAVNEAMRLASPIRSFTRYALRPYAVGDITIPEGARVLILFASANHDERRYPDPETFDLRRNPRDHVGWGHGAHTCVGMHLARLEMEVLTRALLDRVVRVETGRPTPAWNNVLQGFARLPARFYPNQ
jgi:cytochrome P450